MKNIQVGILGYGMAGQVFHAPIINCITGMTIKSIRTKNPYWSSVAKERYPGVTIVAESNEIIDDPEIDLVIVVTPNEFHYPLAKEALLAGKNVVVDKPFTVTSTEALELIQLASERDLLLSVYQNRRFVADFRTVEKVIKSKRLGRLVEVTMNFDRFRNDFNGNWREDDVPGSGILYDLGSHLIDQSIYLFGLPEFITADLRNQRGGKANDYFDIRLDYPGLKVNVRSGMLVKIPGPVFKLNGTNGTFEKFGLDIQEGALTAGLTPNTQAHWGEEPPEQYGKLNILVNNEDFIETIKSEPGDYRLYYQNIYDALTHKNKLLVNPLDALNTIKIIEIALSSNEKKRTLPMTKD
ncbi:MAG: Gfo/Idh/MocA family oxidoreductase [Flammeovirgaceae bacterium]|jgi:scyllo-inositol 2-dehydrogenase (NADP+)|nr:Gfo/Idh/MocA family oxidoreductase [Flammeovirgaceae bacterium]|tara:strand:- start:103 stop:1161 length:1059 start_codon:yes stop_codon:yes gene_type:complete